MFLTHRYFPEYPLCYQSSRKYPLANLDARRMIVESRMNPILLRVKHALPFVFLGLLYNYADQKFFYQHTESRDKRNKTIEDFYKKHPEVLRE